MRFIDDTSKIIEDLCSGELDGEASISKVGDEHIVRFFNRSLPSKAWIISPTDLKEFTWASSLNNLRAPPGTYMVNGVAFSSYEAARDEVARLFPFDQTANRPGGSPAMGYYVPPWNDSWFDSSTTLFYLHLVENSGYSDLWTYDRTKRTWVLLTHNMTVRRWWYRSGAKLEPVVDASFLANEGLAAYCVKDGTQTAAYLYDSRFGKPQLLGINNMGDMRIFLENLFGNLAVQIRMYMVPNLKYLKSIEQIDITDYLYLPGSGVLTPSSRKDVFHHSVLHLDRNHSKILLDPSGRHIARVDANGRERRLWPLETETGK